MYITKKEDWKDFQDIRKKKFLIRSFNININADKINKYDKIFEEERSE